MGFANLLTRAAKACEESPAHYPYQRSHWASLHALGRLDYVCHKIILLIQGPLLLGNIDIVVLSISTYCA